MECPKCSAPYGASDLECARCGLVLTIGLASHRVGLAMMAGGAVLGVPLAAEHRPARRLRCEELSGRWGPC